MGKIFDALEKSKQRLQVPDPPVEPSAVKDRRHLLKKKTAVLGKVAREAENRYSGALPQAVDGSDSKKYFEATEADTGSLDGRRVGRELVTLLRPNSYEAEQFKLLRTYLLFPSSGKPARSIMVTSALPGEGKSFVAANLAISIAQNINDYVLLMDCDLRKPTIQSYFGFDDNVPGMSDYLAHGKALSSVMLKTGVNKMSILPGGKPPHNPSELLSSIRMSKLLDEVKNRYTDRYVVIDSPPPKLTAETSALAKQVDGILVVVKHGSTAREAVRDLVQYVGKEKILGVIVNWFDMRSLNGYHYGAYKKYGNYYSKS